jgi:hypothetical protein
MKFFFQQALLLDLFLFAGWGVSVHFFANPSEQDSIPPMLFDLIPLSGGLIRLIALSLISAFYIRSRRGAIAWIAIVAVAPVFMWLDFYLKIHKSINYQFILHIYPDSIKIRLKRLPKIRNLDSTWGDDSSEFSFS